MSLTCLVLPPVLCGSSTAVDGARKHIYYCFASWACLSSKVKFSFRILRKGTRWTAFLMNILCLWGPWIGRELWWAWLWTFFWPRRSLLMGQVYSRINPLQLTLNYNSTGLRLPGNIWPCFHSLGECKSYRLSITALCHDNVGESSSIHLVRSLR